MREDSEADGCEFDRLRLWRVPVLTLRGEAAVEWLREEWPELRGVAFGREWPVWRRCARLAVDLVDAGQLVPTVETGTGDEGPAHARWRPVPARGAVLAELRQLESALPPSVRADANLVEVIEE